MLIFGKLQLPNGCCNVVVVVVVQYSYPETLYFYTVHSTPYLLSINTEIQEMLPAYLLQAKFGWLSTDNKKNFTGMVPRFAPSPFKNSCGLPCNHGVSPV